MTLTYVFHWWHVFPAILVLGGAVLLSKEDWNTGTYGYRLPAAGCGGLLLLLLAAVFFLGRCAR